MLTYQQAVAWRKQFFSGHDLVTEDAFRLVLERQRMTPAEIAREWGRFRLNPYWVFLQIDAIASPIYDLMMGVR